MVIMVREGLAHRSQLQGLQKEMRHRGSYDQQFYAYRGSGPWPARTAVRRNVGTTPAAATGAESGPCSRDLRTQPPHWDYTIFASFIIVNSIATLLFCIDFFL